MITSTIPTVVTASGLVYTGPCLFGGYVLGTDGVNDPTITIYNNTAGSGQKVIPTATYDASALGINGATGLRQNCNNGLYVAITCAGSVEVVIQYTPLK